MADGRQVVAGYTGYQGRTSPRRRLGEEAECPWFLMSRGCPYAHSGYEVVRQFSTDAHLRKRLSAPTR